MGEYIHAIGGRKSRRKTKPLRVGLDCKAGLDLNNKPPIWGGICYQNKSIWLWTSSGYAIIQRFGKCWKCCLLLILLINHLSGTTLWALHGLVYNIFGMQFCSSICVSYIQCPWSLQPALDLAYGGYGTFLINLDTDTIAIEYHDDFIGFYYARGSWYLCSPPTYINIYNQKNV